MKKYAKLLYGLPRILCILAILFISMFALDAFNPDLTIQQQLTDFLMHLIPSFVLLFFLGIAWKWELIGGIIFMLIGLLFTPFIYTHNYNMNHSVGMSIGIVMAITFPFILVGILFIGSHYAQKENQNPE